MRKSFSVAFVVAAFAAIATPAGAGEYIQAMDGLSKACSTAAKSGRGDDLALQICERAVVGSVRDPRERASNYVNRGVVQMVRGKYELAEADFERAMSIKSDLAEIYLNRGAVRVRQSRFREALPEIDRGLELGPEEPARGYFNRGVARQSLGDFTGAYRDYRKASELAPTWAWPKQAMSEFTVARR